MEGWGTGGEANLQDQSLDGRRAESLCPSVWLQFGMQGFFVIPVARNSRQDTENVPVECKDSSPPRLCQCVSTCRVCIVCDSQQDELGRSSSL